MSGSRARNLALNLLVAGAAAACALVGAELMLRWLAPASTHYYVVRPGTRAVFDPDPRLVPGISGRGYYTINSHGIRGPEFAPAGSPEYRILAVGGSTTEQLYLDQRETWTHLVQASLGRTAAGAPVWVGNVGRSGMTARDHVVQVKYLTREHPRLDAVLVLTGVNDLTAALAPGGRYTMPRPLSDPAAEREQIRRAFAVAPGSFARPVTEEELAKGAPRYKGTALYQLLRRVKFGVKGMLNKHAQDPRGESLARWRDNRRRASRMIDTLPDLAPALAEYRRNLEQIVGLAAARRIRLVLMTQPTIWRPDLTPAEERLLWMGGLGDFQSEPGHAYYTPRALAEAMHRFNEVMLAVCRDRGVECIDLAAHVPKDATMFYDDDHFTEAGSRRVAEVVAAYLRGRPPFAR